MNEIEPSLCRIDDDGARRKFTFIAHGFAAEIGAVEAKNIVDALLRRAAAQQLLPLVVVLGLRETDRTKQGGDCRHGRNMTCQHGFHPSGGKSCGARLWSLPCEGNCGHAAEAEVSYPAITQQEPTRWRRPSARR